MQIVTAEEYMDLLERVARLEAKLEAVREAMKSYSYDGYNTDKADRLGRKLLAALDGTKG